MAGEESACSGRDVRLGEVRDHKVHIAGLQGSQGGLGIRYEFDVDVIEFWRGTGEVGVADQGHVIAWYPFLDGVRAAGPAWLVHFGFVLQAGLPVKDMSGDQAAADVVRANVEQGGPGRIGILEVNHRRLIVGRIDAGRSGHSRSG